MRTQRHSASVIMSGMAIPMAAKTIWKPSDIAIWLRAAKRSVMMDCQVPSDAMVEKTDRRRSASTTMRRD